MDLRFKEKMSDNRIIKIMNRSVIIILVLLLFISQPSYCFAAENKPVPKETDFFSAADQDNKPKEIKYSDNYLTTVALALVFTIVPVAMFVGTIFLVQKKRKYLQKKIERPAPAVCSFCGHKVASYARYCEMCGVNLADGKRRYDICPLCKIPMKKHSHSCVKCGISLH